ncbi:epimerase [Paenibacillus sp. S150]|nr:epimerase [Paenibacillus sp. S150]
MKIRTIITGATGMVGEGVLHECLLNPTVEEVLAINRKPCGIVHPKLTEIIHENFFALSDLGERLAGYNACFFCLGVSSAGMKEETYYRLTHDLTLHAAELLAQWNPDMVFCYVTAAGTDRTEQGRSMWARVKGKTENDLLKLPFRKTYFIRPAFIRPTPGSKRTHKYYYAIGWLYPLLRPLFPQYMISLPEIGQAMIELVNKDYPGDILESCDIAAIVQKIN